MVNLRVCHGEVPVNRLVSSNPMEQRGLNCHEW